MNHLKNKTGRYLLCQWDTYYPLGGLRNIKMTADTVEKLEAYLVERKTDEFSNAQYYSNWAIYDRTDLSLVKESKFSF